MMLPAALTAGGGFLLAILWMDLMFDVQVLKYRNTRTTLPDEVLESIAAYYRRVTTDARPMNLLIALVMFGTLAGCILELVLGHDPRWIGGASLALAGVPIALARVRVIANAVRLGTRKDSPRVQTELARSICRDHLACLVSITLFIGLQLTAAAL